MLKYPDESLKIKTKRSRSGALVLTPKTQKTMKTQSKRLDLYEVTEHRAHFVPQEQRMSEFHAEALAWVADMLSPEGSQRFWSNGALHWYTNEKQNQEQGLWQTENGILMLEDYTEEKLYRVLFS